MMNDDGGPAFPTELRTGWIPPGANSEFAGGKWSVPASQGMTLRDYFAAKAMVGITQALAQGIRPHDVPKVAADAYFIADAMLAARQK